MTTMTRHPWEETEITSLVSMWEAGRKISWIANTLGRREAVVRAKVSHLRRIRPELLGQLEYRRSRHRLTIKDVRAIRKDKRKLKKIGEAYKVSTTTVHNIKARETWKNA